MTELKDRISNASMKWKLLKYARFMGNSETDANKSPSDWKIFSSTSDKPLELFITANNHILITYDAQVMENHSLWNAKESMKAIAKGDSMLVTCKLQSVTRRFRMKLETTEKCNECVRELKRYFPMKSVNSDSQNADGSGSAGIEKKDPEGEVTMATLTEAVLKSNLPQAYKNSNVPTEQLETIIKLCLSDSNFPAFVGQVEKELNKVMSE